MCYLYTGRSIHSSMDDSQLPLLPQLHSQDRLLTMLDPYPPVPPPIFTVEGFSQAVDDRQSWHCPLNGAAPVTSQPPRNFQNLDNFAQCTLSSCTLLLHNNDNIEFLFCFHLKILFKTVSQEHLRQTTTARTTATRATRPNCSRESSCE